MTKVIDLMELYRILEHSDDSQLLLKDIFTAANLDERIDRDVLADTLTAEAGELIPRWNTTVIFKRLAISTFKRKTREIVRDLDALDLPYNPLYEYDEYGAEIVDETIDEDKLRTDDLTNKRTDDLEEKRTDDLEEKRTDDLESKRTDDLADTRTPDYSEETTAGNGSQIDHYVSADNEATLELRTRDVSTVAGQTVTHSGRDTTEHSGTQTTENTGTQTTENTGTQTTENTGTQTTENTGTQRNDRDVDRDLTRNTEKHGRKRTGAELIREEILANHFDIYERIVEIFVDNMCMGVY